MTELDEVADFLERHDDAIRVEVDVRFWREKIRAMCDHTDDQIQTFDYNVSSVEKAFCHEFSLQSLQQHVEKAFCQEFGLQSHRSAETFKIRCLNSDILAGNFDHCTYYRQPGPTGPALVIVSQPYSYARREVKVEAEKLGVDFVDVEEWGWYYPGRARCFMLVFPPATVKRLRKIRRQRHDPWRAHHRRGR